MRRSISRSPGTTTVLLDTATTLKVRDAARRRLTLKARGYVLVATPPARDSLSPEQWMRSRGVFA